MALEPCHECGSEISERAKTCPHCGIKSPFKSNIQRGLEDASNASFGCGCGLFLLTIVLSVLYSMFGC